MSNRITTDSDILEILYKDYRQGLMSLADFSINVIEAKVADSTKLMWLELACQENPKGA